MGAEFKAKVVMTGMGHNETTQLYLKGQRYLLHGNSEGKGDVLVDLEAKKIDVLDANTKQYQEHSTTPLPESSPDPFESIDLMVASGQAVRKKVGSETVNGYLCDKYTLTAQDGSMVVANYWVAQRLGFTLRMVFSIGGAALDVTEIQVGPVADSLLQIPPGYTRTQNVLPAESTPPARRGLTVITTRERDFARLARFCPFRYEVWAI